MTAEVSVPETSARACARSGLPIRKSQNLRGNGRRALRLCGTLHHVDSVRLSWHGAGWTIAAAAVALVVATVVGVLSLSSGSLHLPRATSGRPAITPTIIPSNPPTAAAVRSQYQEAEAFCADLPLSGRVTYAPSLGLVHFDLSLRGLKPNQTYALSWVNDAGNPQAGTYEVGAFSTGASGQPQQGRLRVFRAAEAHGQLLSVSTNPGRFAGYELHPC